MTYDRHLYLILHPNHSLIASQLTPEDFIRHYVMGSSRHFEGKLIFAELDPGFRDGYFDIEDAYSQLLPHEDGRPKATKFIKSYRVLENIDFDALGKLYICNASGDYVALDATPADPMPRSDEMGIMLEINPVKFIVLTRYNYLEFARFITDPANTKGAPKVFYADLEFSVPDFLGEYDSSPFPRTFIPGIEPARLRSAILEVRNTPGKKVKGISLDCPIDRISYKHLRHGFMFASQGKNKYYPLLPLDEVERKFYRFWKTM